MGHYQLLLSKKQVQVLTEALEFYVRIGIGQFEEVARPYTFKVEPEEMDKARSALEIAKMILTGFPANASHGIYSSDISDDYRVAYDIERVIRHYLAWEKNPSGGFGVDYQKPFVSSQQPLPDIKKI